MNLEAKKGGAYGVKYILGISWYEAHQIGKKALVKINTFISLVFSYDCLLVVQCKS